MEESQSATRLMTLLSDFGLQDGYVGVMKGVVAQIDPTIALIDLTHQIPPQNLALARFALMSAVPYFPVGTVHVAVVDPGVGSDRRGVAVAIGSDPAAPVGFLVGPDNGILSGVTSRYPVLAAVALTRSHFWRTAEPSPTFHGRDIFAPVGAHLARGVALAALGPAIAPETLIQLDLPVCQFSDRWIHGCIQAHDQFGNSITNIPAAAVSGKQWTLKVGTDRMNASQTYSDRPPGEPVALIGSHGWVEVAVNQGNAMQQLELAIGTPVEILLSDE